MEKHGRTLTELAYLAGFFDGEGCISSNGQIQINNCCPLPLERFVKRWPDSTIRQMHKAKGKIRTCYTWYATGTTARQITEDLLPFLMEKQPQAALFLQLYKYPKQSEMRKYISQELKTLKRVDYHGYAGCRIKRA
jgi:hypothetical protein